VASGGIQDATVAVLGAGPAGSVAALELARRGLRVTLIGRRPDPRPNIGECLPPGIRPLLEKAGVWEEFAAAGHMPSAGIRSFWSSEEPGDRNFLFTAYGTGWHLDRARFDGMLRKAAVDRGAAWLECDALRAAEPTETGWRLTLGAVRGTVIVDASLVIDATGRSSVFAQRAGATRRMVDRLIGVAGYFAASTGGGVEPALLVEAARDGWWYSAPLPGSKMVCVYMTDAALVQPDGLTSPEAWRALLDASPQQRRRVEAHGGTLEGGIHIVPADTSFLTRIAGDGWLAAGDAAVAFDPLSSQGIPAAVGAGLSAAETAIAWLGGNLNAPVEYARLTRAGFATYLTQRNIFYRMSRWPDSPFWAAHREVTI
jgi:flavin-dependent dehydrogenase